MMTGPTNLPEPADPLSPSEPQTLIKAKLLVGEGKEEVNFFEALLRHRSVSDVQLEQCGGKTRLSNYIATLPKRPGFGNLTAIAITRDADQDPNAAFQSVCTALENAQLVTPQKGGSFGAGTPRVGVFILPDCQNVGMLEDLCLASVTSDLAMPCVDDFIHCVNNRGRQPTNMAKARVHAWLASHVVPDLRLGEAARAGYWDWDSPAFDFLKRFLHQL